MTRSASDVLDQEYLQVRAKILEIGAFFDRLGEAESADLDEQKLDLLKRASHLLTDDQSKKAERIQLLFSREYDQAWRERFGI